MFSALNRNFRGGKIIPVDPMITFFDDNILLDGDNIPGCVNIVDVKTGKSIEVNSDTMFFARLNDLTKELSHEHPVKQAIIDGIKVSGGPTLASASLISN